MTSSEMIDTLGAVPEQDRDHYDRDHYDRQRDTTSYPDDFSDGY